MEKNYPRVLVISHNPFSNTQNNGKTLSSFFKGWPEDRIAQIYISEMEFDTDVCNNYYKITDKYVLNKVLRKNAKTIEKENVDVKKIPNRTSLLKKVFEKRYPIAYFFRNMLWGIVKPWKEENFLKWLDNYKPQVVFFQSSNVYKLYDMVNFIKNRFNCKLILETTDDYVTPKFSLSIFYWWDYFKLVSRYKKMVANSNCIFVIGDMMLQEYSKRFPGNYRVALNCIEINDKVIPYDKIQNETIRFIYAGNLGLNRWKIIKKIGSALEEIYKENNLKVKFDIYSKSQLSKYVEKKLCINEIMKFKGCIDTEQLINERNLSDVLVHVESFDMKNKHITRLSVSTKIPEYLLSDRCILAVGPSDISSIKYIQQNEVGLVIDSLNKNIIKRELLEIIRNREKREKYIDNSKKLAEKRHSFENNKKMVQDEIINSVKI